MEPEKVNEFKKKLKRRRRASIVYPTLKHKTDGEKDIHINSREFTIGRGADNNCILEDITISRSQCEFTLKQKTAQWYLTDMSSSGTFLNNVSLMIDIPCLIKNGDEIRFTTATTVAMGKIYIYTFTCEPEFTASSAKIKHSESKSFNNEVAIENHLFKEPLLKCKIEAVEGDEVNTIRDCRTLLLEIAELKQTIEQQTEVNREQTKKMDELIQQNMIAAQDTAKFRECAETNMSCAICNEIFIKPMMLNCSHVFCQSCITQWKKNKQRCPMCRANITSEKKTFLFDNLIESFHATATEEVRNKRQEVVEERSVQELLSKTAAEASTSRGWRRTNRNHSGISSNRNPPGEVIVLDDSITPARAQAEPIEIFSDEYSFMDEIDIDNELDEFLDSYEDDYTDTDTYSDETRAGFPAARRRDVYVEGIPGEAYGGYGHCYRCGASGHWAPGCPER